MKVRELSYFNPLHSGVTTGTWGSNLNYFGSSRATYDWLFSAGFPAVDKVWVPGVPNMPGETGMHGLQMFSSTHRKRPHYNDCYNRKVVAKAIPTTCFYEAGTVNYWYGWWHYCPQLTIDVDAGWEMLDGHPPLSLHNAQVTAWHEMQPRFEGDISMFNFIYELKDVKSLLHLMRSKPLSKLGKYFRRNKGKVDATKPLAQTHLSVEFALKPLLKDLFTIGCQLEEIVADAQQNFADAGRELSSRHYSETFVHSTQDLRSSAQKSSDPNAPEGVCFETKFTATMEYSYKYNMRSTLDAFMKYWGLGSSRLAIWNAIPFSFVADYFINLSDCIRLTDHDKNVGLELSQYCESLLTKRSTGKFIDTTKTFDGIYGGTIGNQFPTSLGTLVAGVESSIYTRRLATPNYGILVPRIKLPSTKQGVNLAALLRAFF